MDFESYLGSKYQLPIQVTGEIMHPSNSEFSIQEGMFPYTAVSSYLDSAFGNLSQNVGAACLNPGLVSNDMDPGGLTNSPYLAASIEKSALMTDFHSATPLQDGSYMNCSNYNTDSYLNLPSCPGKMSNPRVTSSLGVDHLLVSQQLLEAVQGREQQNIRQLNQLNVLSPMSQSILQANQVAIPSLMKLADSAHVQKKPRFDSKVDDVVLRYMIHQLLLSEKAKQLHSHDSKLAASARQYQVLNTLHKERIQFPSTSIEPHCQQLVTQKPMTCRQKQVSEPQVSPVLVRSGGNCADRLMQYLDNQRHRPKQNSVAYWRKFVAEFFDSGAKKRWCLSKYDHSGSRAHFAFSQGAGDSWNCDICGIKSGRGFEAKFEVLPRLFKVNFDNGVVDELLYLDFPRESKLPSGCMMLQYTKAVQETVYKHSRVVHEGKLRVTFTKELKIISWEFCAQHHEEFVMRRSIAPQVRQLLQVSQKYQDNIDRNKSDGNLAPSLQATHNRLVKSGQQLSKTLDLHAVTELGLPKQLARFLQVAEVIDCMKDLITYSHANNLSPIESLKRYTVDTNLKPKQMNERARQQDARGFSSTGNNPMPMSSVPTQTLGMGSVVINSGAEAEEAWNSSAGTNYYQRFVTGTSNSRGIASNCSSDPSQETSSGAQSCQKLLLTGNSMNSPACVTVKPGPPYLLSSASWHEVVPSSTCESTMQPSNSTGSMSTISFPQTQGDQDPRKYVLNKLLMQKMFSGGAPQEPQLPASSLTVQASGTKGRNATVSRAGGNSKTRTKGQRTPRKGPKSSPSTQAQPKFRGTIKKEMDVSEDLDVPMLPGVQVKEEASYR